MRDYASHNIDETISLIADMVGCNTTNPPGDEHLAAKVVCSFLNRHGISYRTHEHVAGRTNVVAELGKGEKTLLLAAHIDVVPAGEGWDTPPFQLTVKDGRMFGRGVSDDKGPLAGILSAIRYFVENPDMLHCKLLVVAAADEERGSNEGFKYLMANGLVNADFCIIGDIAGHCEEIDIAEKGVAHFHLEVKGKQAHASVPNEGRNAIYAMADWIARIRRYEFKFSPHHILSAPTINVGMISGGIAPNVVAGDCKAVMDMRYLPGMDIEKVRQELLYLSNLDASDNPDVKCSVRIDETHILRPTQLSPDNEDLRLLSSAIEKVKGKKPEFKGFGGATDCKTFIEKGIPAVAFGPGDESVAHLANEYLDVAELEEFISILIEFIGRYR
ncbi:MAG: M20 family metallopeptidase [Candidatus Brocadiia bacterium]